MLLSAAAFGAMGIFGTLAYDEGATVGTLLSVRFALAALVWWGLILASRAALAELRSLRRRDVMTAVALGACGYAGQAGAYFAALERIDANLLALVLYTFPAMVAVAAVALGRERLHARRVLALAMTSAGLVFIVAGAHTGSLDAAGTALGLAAAMIYTVYILTSEGISSRLSPSVLAALVCAGASVTLTVAAGALGQLEPAAVSAAGWGWLACIALVSTVAAVALFFAGLRRVGPTTAAILSTFEPLVTVVLAFAVFGDALTPVQLLGGALMLGGVVVVNLRLSRRLELATA
jgi:drug/metabolite transporter (DMT)-like permease